MRLCNFIVLLDKNLTFDDGKKNEIEARAQKRALTQIIAIESQ